jgi:nitrite reductase/ring-hydroxylating ferredoxin subunit
VAIIKSESGKLYACSNKLPPTGQPAVLGGIFDETVVCPVTSTAFDLKTGKVKGKW